MRKYRLWHRLHGHTITTVPYDPSMGMWRATMVIEQCSCGDGWTFYAIGMHEVFQPADTR